MHCPQCGQRQLSDDVRFCSRCGFHLGVVSELLSSNGILQKVDAKPTLFRNKKALVGAKLMFAGGAMVPFAILASVMFDSPGPFIFPFIFFMLGLIQMLYVLLFGKSAPPEFANRIVINHGTTELGAAIPERVKLTTRTDTSEIVAPSSVTENTTKLLDSSS